MSRLTLFLVFIVLVAENPTMWAGKQFTDMHTPLGVLWDYFFDTTALKFPVFFFVVVALLIATELKKSKDPPAAPMRRAVLIAVGSLLSWAVLGLARGGDFKQIPWQIFNPVCYLLFGLVLMNTIKTVAHVEQLGKVILAASVWRALCGVVYYVFVVRNITNYLKVPPFMTTHDDSTLFVTGIVIVFANLIHRPTRKYLMLSPFILGIILYAIQVNNRRLAWASLVGAIVAMYFMLRPSKARRRVNRIAFVVAPLIAIYVAVGWGRSERIFKPLKSLSSMDAKQDASTASREAENDGLIVTFGQGYFTGTGWGHKYIEVNNTYRLDGIFDQWAYIPHNSLLGVLAFMGVLGFAGAWLPLPMSVFLNARSYKASIKPIEQTAAMVGVAEVIIYANQMYGDMGFASATSLVLLMSAYASAARISVATQGWPSRKKAPSSADGSKAPAPGTSAPVEGELARGVKVG